jgi:hypothetical protein
MTPAKPLPIERAAAAFGLDPDTDRDLLLGTLADIAFPMLRLDGPWWVEEYRAPSKARPTHCFGYWPKYLEIVSNAHGPRVNVAEVADGRGRRTLCPPAR